MATVMYVAALFSTVIGSAIVAVVVERTSGDNVDDEEILFFGLGTAIVILVIWLSVFAIVFRNSIHF